MSIVQFLRILWARSWIVAAATISCMIGAFIVIMILPPRWEAHSRVMLELLKPDPVTGQINQNASTRGYIATQSELIKDYSVAGQVADDLGLLSDPTLIRQYQGRDPKDKRDFRRWVTQLIVDRTNAELVEGSNIMQISYTGSDPEQSRVFADALRKAYMEASRGFRIEQAAKNAEWYEQQAEKARAQLDEAEKVLTAYERENGVIIEEEGADLESARLKAIAGSVGMSAPVFAPPSVSQARSQLAQVDAQISEQSQILGPNHPELQALRTKRISLAQQAVMEESASRATAAAAGGSSTAAMQRAMDQQRTRVMGQRDKMERGRQLMGDVTLRRDLWKKTMERAAEFRHEAAAPVTNLTVLGSAVAPQSPKFPNKPLILFGALVLGLGSGVGIGLLMELFGRRIRGVEDLRDTIDAPVLAVITSAADSGARGTFIRLSRRIGRSASKPGSANDTNAVAA